MHIIWWNEWTLKSVKLRLVWLVCHGHAVVVLAASAVRVVCAELFACQGSKRPAQYM